MLLLDDERAQSSPTAKVSGGRRQAPSSQTRKRPHSSESGTFRDVRIHRGGGSRSDEPRSPARSEGDEGRGEGVAAGREEEDGTRGGGIVDVRSVARVDFSVVDYVLRKPFSDDSLRRLLEAVEQDHLQVGVFSRYRQTYFQR